MTLKIDQMHALPCNYSQDGRKPIEYIVLHYTANNGDRARGNAIFLQNSKRAASAHYFVDETEAIETVDPRFVAWHCGAKVYRHPFCRNANSIGIELCSRQQADGVFYFKHQTLENAVELCTLLMREYCVTPDRVLRHFDVTGKVCPAPFVAAAYDGSKFTKIGHEAAAWAEFKEQLCL